LLKATVWALYHVAIFAHGRVFVVIFVGEKKHFVSGN